MVDFKKYMVGKTVQKPLDPIAIYETLDRAVDKGPLRPAQQAVLRDWYGSLKSTRDVIVKLHTGQGKTIIGLLMLQSRINQRTGPAVYLCPDKFLIDQTCEQAKQFGIATCKVTPELPEAFLNGDRILVTSIQKLFNGLTKFGLRNKSIHVGTLLMDDAHACSDIVRAACRIKIAHTEPAYAELMAIFADDLEQQGLGTYADIRNDKHDAFLPIPYWAWVTRVSQVATVLSNYAERESIKYTWPLLRDMLSLCQGVISGAAIEIEPHIPPLSTFGSYWSAPHRIFMSATVTDDAFLVKGLQLSPETISSPLTFPNERWSGEKMVLIPSLISESLDRSAIVEAFGKPNAKRAVGVVALAPSFLRTKDWEKYGAFVSDKVSVSGSIESLRQGKYDTTFVLVNRYDGIDLPDNTCRLLIFDGRPYSESLVDLHHEMCRPNSEAILMRTVRTVEQGMGRSVRGQKDYSVIVVIGPELTRLVRDSNSRKFLSPQMACQIEIGLMIADMARQEIEEGVDPLAAFNGLIKQCLNRDGNWKAFYSDKMAAVMPSGANTSLLQTYAAELEAELAFNGGDYDKAVQIIQKLLDSITFSPEEKAWYLQEMARFIYVAKVQIQCKNQFVTSPVRVALP